MEKLISFIRSHDHLCFALPCGNIRVRGVYTFEDNKGARRIGRQWETIPANMQAVREWLGY